MTVAMLTSMLVTAAPALALTAATVTTSNSTVAANGTWDIRFTVNTAITWNGTDGGNITITFPSGFTVNQSAANVSSVTIAAGPGWLSTTSFGNANITSLTTNSTSASRKVRLSFAATDVIGADAQIRIILPVGVVTNPTTQGSYTITVATSNETTAVTSASFSIGLPSIGPLPGVVTGKNSAGDILYQDITGNLATAIGTAGVSRIELGTGTYNATNTASTINQTIIGVGAAGTVILTAPAAGIPLTISNYGVVIENVVINGNIDGTANLTSVTANATLRNVTFNGGVSQLATGSSAVVTVENCIFNVTGNVTSGISTINATVVKSSTFTVDSSGTGISNTGNLTVAGSTFTGSGTSTGISVGTGLAASTNNTDIRTSTFTTLRQALVIGNENVSANGNTITGGGESTASDTRGVVTQSAGASTLVNNTITNSNAAYYALHVSGGNLTARFNNITGNTLNVRLTGGTANATHNWWGASAGPSAASINATTPNDVHMPHLTGAPSAGSGVVAFGTSNLTAQTVAGVDVTSSNGTMGTVAAAKYAANPQTVAPTGTPVAYYDVYVGAPADGSTITIRFYAAVTENTKVYYGGGLSGAWSLAGNQGVNVNSGFAYVTITSTSLPSFSDMTGTPFVLTNIVPPPAAPVLTSPEAGATGVPTTTGFAWTAVAGATYEFQVSTSPTFATLTANATNLSNNVYGGVALAANTTYFWRVHAMSGMLMSAWTVSTFTTAAPVASVAPVIVPPAVVTVNPAPITINPPPPAQVTIQPPPPAQITVTAPTVNVAAPPPAEVTVNVPDPTQPIPSYILWTIILIGAVLIIALIVLIVRTRRVA
jgi:hypothetical protein